MISLGSWASSFVRASKTPPDMNESKTARCGIELVVWLMMMADGSSLRAFALNFTLGSVACENLNLRLISVS